MAKDTLDADVVHCHTWYTHMAGFLAKQAVGRAAGADDPFARTAPALEGRAARQRLSTCRLDRADRPSRTPTPSSPSRRRRATTCSGTFAVDPERVHVIHNGIDLDEYRRDRRDGCARAHGVDPDRPYVLFVGRITRQKGIIHLVNAIPAIDPSLQVVLVRGRARHAARSARRWRERVAEVSARPAGRDLDPRRCCRGPTSIGLYSHAAVFCCPSVYEPFGIINLEAMACETAVVASAVGGIPEVVVPGETGLLVDLEIRPGTFDPVDPAASRGRWPTRSTGSRRSRAARSGSGAAGRKRVEDHFSWAAIAAPDARPLSVAGRWLTRGASRPTSTGGVGSSSTG